MVVSTSEAGTGLQQPKDTTKMQQYETAFTVGLLSYRDGTQSTSDPS